MRPVSRVALRSYRGGGHIGPLLTETVVVTAPAHATAAAAESEKCEGAHAKREPDPIAAKPIPCGVPFVAEPSSPAPVHYTSSADYRSQLHFMTNTSAKAGHKHCCRLSPSGFTTVCFLMGRMPGIDAPEHPGPPFVKADTCICRRLHRQQSFRRNIDGQRSHVSCERACEHKAFAGQDRRRPAPIPARLYNYMGSGLAITGLVAYGAGALVPLRSPRDPRWWPARPA